MAFYEPFHVGFYCAFSGTMKTPLFNNSEIDEEIALC